MVARAQHRPRSATPVVVVVVAQQLWAVQVQALLVAPVAPANQQHCLERHHQAPMLLARSLTPVVVVVVEALAVQAPVVQVVVVLVAQLLAQQAPSTPVVVVVAPKEAKQLA
jgi:hypothetical protein